VFRPGLIQTKGRCGRADHQQRVEEVDIVTEGTWVGEGVRLATAVELQKTVRRPSDPITGWMEVGSEKAAVVEVETDVVVLAERDVLITKADVVELIVNNVLRHVSVQGTSYCNVLVSLSLRKIVCWVERNKDCCI
jgi:hypothetical protein